MPPVNWPGTIGFYTGATLITVFEIIFMCTNVHRKRNLQTRVRKKRDDSMAKLNSVLALRKLGSWSWFSDYQCATIFLFEKRRLYWSQFNPVFQI